MTNLLMDVNEFNKIVGTQWHLNGECLLELEFAAEPPHSPRSFAVFCEGGVMFPKMKCLADGGFSSLIFRLGDLRAVCRAITSELDNSSHLLGPFEPVKLSFEKNELIVTFQGKTWRLAEKQTPIE